MVRKTAVPSVAQFATVLVKGVCCFLATRTRLGFLGLAMTLMQWLCVSVLVIRTVMVFEGFVVAWCAPTSEQHSGLCQSR